MTSDEPRGVPLGIPNAPSVLPEEKQLRSFPLRVCSGGPDEEGLRPTTVELGGAPTTTARSADVLLADEAGNLSLVLGGTAHPLPNHRNTPPSFLTSLRFSPVRTGQAFISSLPLGVPLTRIVVAGEGEKPAATDLGELTVGSVGTTTSPQGNKTWWVLQKDGFSLITPLDAELMLDAGIPTIPNLDIDRVNSHRSKDSELNSGDLPHALPEPPASLATTDAVCATWATPGRAPVVTVGATDLPTVTRRPGGGGLKADRVVVPAGRGALVQADDLPDPRGASSLVVDGLRYAIPDEGTRQLLGYQGAPARVPAQVIALVPEGMPAGGVLSTREALTQLS